MRFLGAGGKMGFGRTSTYATGGDYVYLYKDTTTGKTYRVHEFLTAGATATLNVEVGGKMEYLIVAGGGGGGGGGYAGAGGGGAGGATFGQILAYKETISILVGSGGSGGGNNYTQAAAFGGNGGTSSFGTIVLSGGGGGAPPSTKNGKDGGSGGGAGGNCGGATAFGGSGITGQGHQGSKNRAPMNAGVNCANGRGGNGGGAGGPGEIWGLLGDDSIKYGGIGIEWPIGSGNWYAGGGGGSMETGSQYGRGGTGGGGDAGNGKNLNGRNGTDNKGGGGGGGCSNSFGGTGGSGIVIVRYPIVEYKLWTPSKLSSLIAWYDVSSEDGLNDQDNMTQLTDFSNNNLDMPVHSTGTPKYIANQLNGLPVVDFGGAASGGYFRRADSSYGWSDGAGGTAYPTSRDPFTVCGIAKLNTGTDTTATFFTTEDFAAPTVSRAVGHGFSWRYFNSIGGYHTSITNSGLYCIQGWSNGGLGTSYKIMVASKDSNGIATMRSNGVEGTLTPVYQDAGGASLTAANLHSCVSQFTYRSVQIGGFISNRTTGASSVSNANNRLAEVMYFNQELTTEEKQKLEGYLAHKWGLTNNLPAGHPYKYEPPYT